MQKLTVDTKKLPDTENAYMLVFNGDFDGYAQDNVTDIQTFIDNAGEKVILVFDFTKLNYLNSYAIGHMVSWRNHVVDELGGRIIIAGTSKNVEDIFTILGINALFEFYPDIEEAKKNL